VQIALKLPKIGQLEARKAKAPEALYIKRFQGFG
jgi:hypothetical protein